MQIASGGANWLPAQRHHGENIGDTDTHVIFVELEDHARRQARRLRWDRSSRCRMAWSVLPIRRGRLSYPSPPWGRSVGNIGSPVYAPIEERLP